MPRFYPHARIRKKRTFSKRRKLALICASVAVIVLVLASAFSILPFGGSGKAQADSADAYPTSCLGGWQSPANAEGAPDAGEGSDAIFTGANSAVLEGADAQLFCGSFASADTSVTPSAVTLSFSWNVIFPGAATTTSSVGTVATDTDSSDWTDVLDTTSTATSTVSAPASTTPDDSSTDDASSSSAAPATPPAPAPDTTDGGNATGTSLMNTLFGKSLSLLTQKAFADSTDTDMDASTTDGGFMDVSYSLDGTTWQDLGDVTESNWQNFSVTLPISSWNDVSNVQVRLTPILTADPPTVYLDGMWLEVDGGSSLGGVLQQAASSTLGVIGDINQAIENTVSDLLPDDSTSTDLTDNTTSTDQDDDTTPAPSASPPPPSHQYDFGTQGSVSVDTKDLPWLPSDAVKNYDANVAAMSGAAAPTVSVVDDNSIRVAGTCSEKYYVILLFADENDYESNPSSALFNQAEPCTGGSFSETITDAEFPPQLAAGTYYLVVANEAAKGPWEPFPQIYPVTINPDTSSQ